MSIYDRKLEGTDDIFNAIKEIVDKGNLGNKIEIVRMFSAARREYELNQLKDKFEEKSGRKYIREVIVIDEQSAIVISQRDDNPEHGFCMKTDNLNASTWINKMLGIEQQ